MENPSEQSAKLKQVPTEFDASPPLTSAPPPLPQKPLPPLPQKPLPPLPQKPKESEPSEPIKKLIEKGYSPHEIQRAGPQFTPIVDEIIKEDVELEEKKRRSILIVIVVAILFVVIIILIVYFYRKSEGFTPAIPQKQYYRKLYHQPYYDRTNNIYYW